MCQNSQPVPVSSSEGPGDDQTQVRRATSRRDAGSGGYPGGGSLLLFSPPRPVLRSPASFNRPFLSIFQSSLLTKSLGQAAKFSLDIVFLKNSSKFKGRATKWGAFSAIKNRWSCYLTHRTRQKSNFSILCFWETRNYKGPHTINAANGGSSRDQISQRNKIVKTNLGAYHC